MNSRKELIMVISVWAFSLLAVLSTGCATPQGHNTPENASRVPLRSGSYDISVKYNTPGNASPVRPSNAAATTGIENRQTVSPSADVKASPVPTESTPPETLSGAGSKIGKKASMPTDVLKEVKRLSSATGDYGVQRVNSLRTLAKMGQHAVEASPFVIRLLDDTTAVMMNAAPIGKSGTIFDALPDYAPKKGEVAIAGQLSFVRDEALQTLRSITGQDFGPDKDGWQAWWQQRGKRTSP